MQGIFRKENTDKALKYGIYRHLPTYEKIIRNLVSFYNEKNNIKISHAKGYEISTREHYYLMEELTKRADSRMYENKRLMKGKRLDGRRLNV